MSNVIFEAGDVVTCAFFGDKEFVLKETNKTNYPILIDYASEDGKRRDELFTRKGFSHGVHTSPVLKLVRKKSKERELIEIYAVVRPFSNNKSFDTYEEALGWIKEKGITSHEYKIEKFYKVKE